MSKVFVLGGAGAVGSVAARTLALVPGFDEVVICDLNEARIRELAESLNRPGVTWRKVDVLDKAELSAAIADATLVVNCVGPFYKFVKPILETVIECGKDYLDVCDDVDVTTSILEWDAKVKQKGLRAVIGMGNSPGITNLMARFAADHLFDKVEAVDIFHAHGGEPTEGPGVIAHRFHCMTIDIPMYLDSELKYVKFFDAGGLALREQVDFPLVGDNITVYPYPHPEQVTIPHYIKTSRVTNKGTVVPQEYYDLISDVVKAGGHSKEPVVRDGKTVIPYDESISFILAERERILQKLNFGSQRGAVKIVVSGTKKGKFAKYEFVLASKDQALGEGTGIPAAMGAILMLKGKITRKGVYPPEAGVDPLEFMKLVKTVISLTQKNKSFKGLQVWKTDHSGRRKEVNVTFVFTKLYIWRAIKSLFTGKKKES